MANANMTNHKRVHYGHFPLNTAFANPVTDVTLDNFQFTTLDGNGIIGLVFNEVMGSPKNISYLVSVEIPANVQGSFRAEIVGTVMNADGVAEPVRSNPRIYAYDTREG